ncbi:unnamed protein product [Vitrella brassicaformis CCMP3155]|uniref:Uncharacterized protein n=1 Tax=Vitrella brassicaformis (strain CCMP3155) TaxID=1169540 RepID=A0A0G4GCU5_VITBC|nr:unnamed protein product [Vitrella brassicaformis CCMP3155]|eukprot:CEM27099.1 unnamed protein product [Vitrella brassicaformis CCMP3155]
MQFMPGGADIGRIERVCSAWCEASHAGKDMVWKRHVQDQKAKLVAARMTRGEMSCSHFDHGPHKEQYAAAACTECGAPGIYELPMYRIKLCEGCADANPDDQSTFNRSRKGPQMFAKLSKALVALNRMRGRLPRESLGLPRPALRRRPRQMTGGEEVKRRRDARRHLPS